MSNDDNHKQTSSGLFVPDSFGRIVQTGPVIYWLGGTGMEAPPKPTMTKQLPAALSMADICKTLEALINQNAALVRELDRHRQALGLPVWQQPTEDPPEAPANEAPAED